MANAAVRNSSGVGCISEGTEDAAASEGAPPSSAKRPCTAAPAPDEATAAPVGAPQVQHAQSSLMPPAASGDAQHAEQQQQQQRGEEEPDQAREAGQGGGPIAEGVRCRVGEAGFQAVRSTLIAQQAQLQAQVLHFSLVPPCCLLMN